MIEKAELLKLLDELGDEMELEQVVEYVIETLVFDGSAIRFSGEARKTVLLAELGIARTYITKKYIATHDGHFVSPDQIVGECVECKKRNISTVLSQIGAGKCKVCGCLLCPKHQKVFGGEVYCKQHWFLLMVEAHGFFPAPPKPPELPEIKIYDPKQYR